MNIFKEIPPTAGFPIYAKDFLALLNPKSYRNSLEEDFRNYLGVPYAKVTYSGTAAFYLILESLKQLSEKKTVIIPAFICPLIPLAIKRAGLKVRVCDINKDSFDFNYPVLEQICSQNNDVLAIIAVHLAGLPVDLDKIKLISDPKKIFIIEDCAQSLVAEYKNKKVGTLGDFAFFSLCRGKGLTIFEGGIIVTQKNEYSSLIDKTIKNIAKNNILSEALKILELFGYGVIYRPQLFWFVSRLPEIFWQWRNKGLKATGEYFTAGFPVHNVSRLRKTIGHIIFSRLDQEIDKQRQKAKEYIEQLKVVKGIKIIAETAQDKATYPYLVIIFDEPRRRNKVLEISKHAGLGISQIYTFAVTDYAYLKELMGNQDAPNARYLAQREITLSTSSFLKEGDLKTAVEIIAAF